MGVDWYPNALNAIDNDARIALEQTGEEVRRDLTQSQTVPYRTGWLQRSVYVDRTKASRGQVSVVTNTPYARRLYFHPEYRFSKAINDKAGGEWYKPYLDKGKKRKWLEETYAKLLKARRG